MAQVQTSIPQVGDQAPDFTLKDTDLNEVSLHDFHGKRVILVFFPAAFTGTCTAELCSFRDSMAQLNRANAQVLGISVDLPFSLKQFRSAQGLQFPLLSDYDHVAITAYGVTFANFHNYRSDVARRSVFVIDPEGTITWRWLSDNPGQEPNYQQVLEAVGG